MAENCPVCGKSMPPEDVLHLTRWGLSAYSFDVAPDGASVHHDFDQEIVCSKACMITALERKAKTLPQREERRVCLVLTTTDGKEMLESLARLLRSLR